MPAEDDTPQEKAGLPSSYPYRTAVGCFGSLVIGAALGVLGTLGWQYHQAESAASIIPQQVAPEIPPSPAPPAQPPPTYNQPNLPSFDEAPLSLSGYSSNSAPPRRMRSGSEKAPIPNLDDLLSNAGAWEAYSYVHREENRKLFADMLRDNEASTVTN